MPLVRIRRMFGLVSLECSFRRRVMDKVLLDAIQDDIGGFRIDVFELSIMSERVRDTFGT